MKQFIITFFLFTALIINWSEHVGFTNYRLKIMDSEGNLKIYEVAADVREKRIEVNPARVYEFRLFGYKNGSWMYMSSGKFSTGAGFEESLFMNDPPE
jgi:hypothetical protein